MKTPSIEEIDAIVTYRLLEVARAVLKGMQGPEQGLVGESRSDGPKGQAEAPKEGERGVGKIVERTEQMRHLDRKIIEAHGRWVSARDSGNHVGAIEFGAMHDALLEMRLDFERIAEERSDLPNADVDARRDIASNQTGG